MTLENLPFPTYTGEELADRVDAALIELRAARRFPSVAALLADVTMAYGTGNRAVAVGDYIEAGDFRYQIAAAGATDHHLTTAGGVKLYVQPGVYGYNVLAFAPTLDAASGAEAAIAKALTAAASAGGGEVWMPSATYGIGTAKITQPVGVAVRAGMGAVVRSSAIGTCWEMLGSAAFGARQTHLPAIRRDGDTPDWFMEADTTSVGVELVGCRYEQVFLREVRGFHIGLRLRAVANSNCVCNTVHLGQITNNRVGLTFREYRTGTASELRGANQNSILGGVIRIDTSLRKPGCHYIQMPDAENNANLFLGVNLEDATGGVVAVLCNSYSNTWLNCRFENAATHLGVDPIQFGATSAKNTISGTMQVITQDGPWTAIVDDQGGNNLYISDGAIATKRVKWDINNGRLYFGNGSMAPDVPLQGYGTDLLWIGDAATKGTRHFGYVWQEEVERTSNNPVLPNNCQHIRLSYTAPVTITGMNGGGPADLQGLFTILSTNGNVTLQHSASPAAGAGLFVLARTGGNRTLAANIPALFVLDNGNFYEV